MWKMKNIIVSVDDETYRLSRIKAAEAGTPVSELLREYLFRLTSTVVPNSEFEQLQKLQDELIDSIHKRGGGLRPSENFPATYCTIGTCFLSLKHPCLVKRTLQDSASLADARKRGCEIVYSEDMSARRLRTTIA